MISVIVTGLVCGTVLALGVMAYLVVTSSKTINTKQPSDSQEQLSDIKAKLDQLADEVSSHSIALGIGIRNGK